MNYSIILSTAGEGALVVMLVLYIFHWLPFICPLPFTQNVLKSLNIEALHDSLVYFHEKQSDSEMVSV